MKIKIIDKDGDNQGYFDLKTEKNAYGDIVVAEQIYHVEEYHDGYYDNELLYINLDKGDKVPDAFYLDYGEPKILFSENKIVKKATDEVLRKGEYIFSQSEIDELEECYYSIWTSFKHIGFEYKTCFKFYIDGSDKYSLKLDSLKRLSDEHFKLWYSENKYDKVKILKERYFTELYHYLKNKGVDFFKIEIDTGFCYKQENIYNIYKNELTYMDYDWENPDLEVWNTGGDFLIEYTKLLTDEEVLEYLLDEIYKSPDDFDEYPSDVIKLILKFVEEKL